MTAIVNDQRENAPDAGTEPTEWPVLTSDFDCDSGECGDDGQIVVAVRHYIEVELPCERINGANARKLAAALIAAADVYDETAQR